MAATEPLRGEGPAAHRVPLGLLLAGLALPALTPAQAETAPEQAEISVKTLDYRDSQPGWDRIKVRAQAVELRLPVAGNWLLEGSATRDTISGASPSYHTETLRAGHIEERRNAWDAKVTRYFGAATLAVGVAASNESDYTSRAASLSGSLATEDRNTTLLFGVGASRDRIDVPEVGVVDADKRVSDAMIGVARVLTPRDVVQVNLSHASARGYLSDPYKYRDNRPSQKRQTALLGRWNHHFESVQGTLRTSWRYYEDSFGIEAHTLTAEYVQPLPGGWTLTPALRLHQQNAADFYLDPVNPPFPTIVPREQWQSQDQRLSAFGGRGLAMKLSYQATPDLRLDLRFERYEQRSSWRLSGSGSPGLAPFRADSLQAGFTYRF